MAMMGRLKRFAIFGVCSAAFTVVFIALYSQLRGIELSTENVVVMAAVLGVMFGTFGAIRNKDFGQSDNIN